MIEDQILELIDQADPANPIDFVHKLVKPLAKKKLDEYILGCEDCDICNTKKTITNGNPNASILIIGESSTEDQQTDSSAEIFPFNNESGESLAKVLEKLNVNKDEIFFMNSVNCFPHRENNGIKIKRAPTKTERTNCKVFLDYAVKMVEPLLIICLGGVATNDINEEIGKQNISKIRGQYFMYRGVNVMPTYHPGYFIELEKSERLDDETISSYTWDFFNDLQKAFTDLQKQYPNLNIINKE
jgi:DNA polymerase